MPKKPKRKDKPTLAQKADRYACYLKSVQEPEHELDFFDQAYRDAHGGKPKVLREDFCGTAAVSCGWVKRRGCSAVAVDLDAEPLDWGRQHLAAKLTAAQRKKLTLMQGDVRDPQPRGLAKADVLAAQNFSFWVFRTRPELLTYLERAHDHLAEKGVMVMDMMGGGECYVEEHEDVRTISKKMDYVWEQHRFNPVTNRADFYISFRFKDGSALERCFHYHWRFWTIPEVCELLYEAGFDDAKVYWEVTTDDGDETGDWEPVDSAPSDASWIAYIVGVKRPRR
jgi:hypothetical protein